MAEPRPDTRSGARGVALQALLEIDDGAYANLAVPKLLSASRLDARDRGFVTELAYGTTRMRRACDWLVDRFVTGDRPLDLPTRNTLRLGAYQLAFTRVAPHAAVSATVDLASPKARGLVNAVLRKVAGDLPPRWPDRATELSYPDWLIEQLVADLGAEQAHAALVQMNEPPSVTERPDGYIQDVASQLVAAVVDVQPGELVADLCAAPGGKATAMASVSGRPLVAASDRNPIRAGLVAENVADLRLPNVATLVADGLHPPYRPASFDRVLLDAPCSGLGVLRRRPDARWRIQRADVGRLARLQRDLLHAAAGLVRPGGTLVYSVCTLTLAETAAVDRWLYEQHPELRPVPVPAGGPWEPLGRGARLLPQTQGTDGMYVLKLERAGR
ncbi:MAG TPA: transcription antitermination factor NusB [Acidimicrobiales bacterium]|nr:transcription antitermination factor NusB [Acidimicrobiales bacterium]